MNDPTLSRQQAIDQAELDASNQKRAATDAKRQAAQSSVAPASGRVWMAFWRMAVMGVEMAAEMAAAATARRLRIVCSNRCRRSVNGSRRVVEVEEAAPQQWWRRGCEGRVCEAEGGDGGGGEGGGGEGGGVRE